MKRGTQFIPEGHH